MNRDVGAGPHVVDDLDGNHKHLDGRTGFARHRGTDRGDHSVEFAAVGQFDGYRASFFD